MISKYIFAVIFPLAILFSSAYSATIYVPTDVSKIQKAVDRSANGDTVLIAPGNYRVNLNIDNKQIVIASHFVLSGDEEFIESTVLDGGDLDHNIIQTSGKLPVSFIGLTLTNGDDGIHPNSPIIVEHCHIFGTKDAIDFESGSGGRIANCLIDRNRDDALDLDEDCDVLIENNVLRDNDDDGIEIRLHPWLGHQLHVVIQNNVISGNGEDGIQFIWYNTPTNRIFTIANNLFIENDMAGIACMDDSTTVEDYRAADIPESIAICGNSFIDNEFGIVGGDNMKIDANSFINTHKAALMGVNGRSIIGGNTFWNNTKDLESSNMPAQRILTGEPHQDGRPMLKNVRK